MMDLRHFTLDEPPRMPTFVDPGVAPPSFIYALDQNGPPYDLSASSIEPFPGCDATYATVCAVQHSIRLVTRVREEACQFIEAGGTQRQNALDNITNGAFTADGTSGFGVFVLLPNGTLVADQLVPSLVGERFDGYLSSGLVAQSTLLDWITYVTDWKGGFVPHYSTRISTTTLSVLGGDAPLRATAYFEKCESGERIGVAFGRDPLPAVEECDGNSNSFCSMQNARRLTGRSLVDGLNTLYHEGVADQGFKMNYEEDYSVGDFYTFLYHMSWWGYPGSNPYRNPGILDDNLGTCIGLGGGLHGNTAGGNLSWIPNKLGDGTPLGYWLQGVLDSAAWAGGAWQDYPWATAALGSHTKVSFAVGFVLNGTAYGTGAGLVHKPASAASGPNCDTCNVSASLTCSVQNAMRLTSHAQLEFLTPDSKWETLSKSQWFGSLHPDADTGSGAYTGTWPEGFYVFGASFNGTVVVDGSMQANIGLDVSAVLGDDTAHERLKVAANNGGSFVQINATDGTKYLMRVTKLAGESQFYYIGVAFKMAWASWTDDCPATYSEPCSESNAQAIVGAASADLLSAQDATELKSRINEIVNATGRYASDYVGDYRVYILDSDFACAADVACVETWPSHWISAIETASAVEDGSWAELASTSSLNGQNAYVFHLEWSNPTSVATQDFILVTLINTDPAPPRCSSTSDCPSNSVCASGMCVCSGGFRAYYSLNTTSCGELLASDMFCGDVRGLYCSSSSNDSCVTCPAGYYCPSGAKIPCPAGSFCPAGAAAATPCPVGRMGNDSLAVSLDECYQCTPGSYQSKTGETDCALCDSGSYSQSAGASSCTRCAVGAYQENEGSTSCLTCPTQFTTLIRGSTASSDCVCPAGLFQKLGSMSCSECIEGMECEEANATEAAMGIEGSPQPLVAAGYASLATAPLGAYKCKETAWCPGGYAGECARNRDTTVVGCSKCIAHTYSSDDGTCTECDDGTATIILIFAILATLVGLAVFGWVVNRNQLNQTSAATNCIISMGLTVSAIQTLGIMSNLTVKWVEPIKSMFKVLTVLSFDLKVLRIECMVGQNSVVNLVARQGVAPLAALYIALVVGLKKMLAQKDLEFRTETINAVGAVFQLFFVSIVVSSLTPFICYKHPGDLGHSMVSDPSVLCTETGQHAELVAVCCTAIALVVAPFVALTTFATVKYRVAMGNSVTSYRHLRRFRFLFFRYNPEAYWFGVVTLLRGLLICLVPVIARDQPALQIITMTTILLGFCALQMSTQPWRGTIANLMDCGISMLMILMLTCVAMSTDFDSDTLLGTLAAIVFVTVFAGVMAVIAASAYKHVVPSPYFSKFICHHKADAAAQARFLQMLFVQRSNRSCFLDSDHLTNLEELFDTVRCRCGRLIVYLTTDTLRRPWCAGEITIAWQVHQRVSTICHPSFIPPTSRELEVSNIGQYLATADFKLVEYSIIDDYIVGAYRWLLNDLTDKYYLNMELVGRRRFEAVVSAVLMQSPSRSFLSAMKKSMTKLDLGSTTVDENVEQMVRPGALIFSSLPDDDEATAAAGILIGQVQASIVELVPAGMIVLTDMADPTSSEVIRAVASAHAVVVILSNGSLDSTPQLQIIVTAVTEDVHCIPVNMPSFRFPKPSFFEDLKLRFGEVAGDDVEARVQSFFKMISVGLTTYASQQVLAVQAESLVHRLPKLPKSVGKRLTDSSTHTDKLTLAEVESAYSVSPKVTRNSTRSASEQPQAGLLPKPAACTELVC